MLGLKEIHMGLINVTCLGLNVICSGLNDLPGVECHMFGVE